MLIILYRSIIIPNIIFLSNNGGLFTIKNETIFELWYKKKIVIHSLSWNHYFKTVKVLKIVNNTVISDNKFLTFWLT